MKSIIPSSFVESHGELWKPTAADLSDEYSAGYLASGMQRQIVSIFESKIIRSKAPKLFVHVATLPFGDVRNFIWRSKNRPNEFVLAMHIGTFEKFSELLSEESLWKELMPRLTYLRRINRPDFLRLASYLAVYAAVSHELAHIIRGHIGLLDAIPAETPEKRLEYKKLYEVEADKRGSFVLAGQVAMQARYLAQEMCGTFQKCNEIAFDLLALLGMALYRCYSLYNQVDTTQPSLHPDPLLRAANVAIGAADNFSDVHDFEHVRRRLLSLLTGMSLVENFGSHSIDLPQKKWDIGTEFVSFQRTLHRSSKN